MRKYLAVGAAACALLGVVPTAMGAPTAHRLHNQPARQTPASAAPKLLSPGVPAPDFTLPTAKSAKPLTLSALKGHPVLIDFWASWCPPCKAGLPHTQALADEFGRKGLTVLAVNSWDTKAGMQAFLKAHPEYTMTVLFDDHPGTSGHRQGSIARDLYHITGIPTIYLIDKDGHIAASFEGYADDTEAQIRAALAKLGIA